MTQKEKAIELVEKMYQYTDKKKQAVCCAIIAVDEILQTIVQDDYESRNYWQEVKEEIEKL